MDNWHPWVVHFPLVLLPLSFFLDLLALVRKRKEWHFLSYWFLILGTLTAVGAVLSGNEAAVPYRSDETVRQYIERHENLATLALILLLATVLGRLPLHLQGRLQGRSFKVWIAVAGLGSVLLWQVGHYGGELVYYYGVGVKD